MAPRSQRGRSGSRLALSVVLGVVLIPLSAVGAVLLTEHRPEPGPTAEATEEATTIPKPSVVPEYVYSNVEATTEDLAYACGEGGQALVAAETAGEISEVQQSALDALRGICESQGTPLPGKEGPPPIVETRTVTIQAPAPPAPAVNPSTPESSTTTVAEDGEEPVESGPTTTVVDPGSTTETEASEKYAAVYEQALAEIDYAVSVGGNLEKIAEARKKLEEAERAASAGNYEEATKKSYEAIGKAREAIGEEEDH